MRKRRGDNGGPTISRKFRTIRPVIVRARVLLCRLLFEINILI